MPNYEEQLRGNQALMELAEKVIRRNRCADGLHEPREGHFGNYPTVKVCRHCKSLYEE